MGYVRDIPIEEQARKYIPTGFAIAKQPIRCEQGTIEAGTRLYISVSSCSPEIKYDKEKNEHYFVLQAKAISDDEIVEDYFVLPCSDVDPETGKTVSVSFFRMEEWVNNNLEITDNEEALNEEHRRYINKIRGKRNEAFQVVQFLLDTEFSMPILLGFVVALFVFFFSWYMLSAYHGAVFGFIAWITSSTVDAIVRHLRLESKQEEMHNCSADIEAELFAKLMTGETLVSRKE